MDARVAWPTPEDIAISRPRRQLESVLVKPQQGLPGATQFGDLGEYQADRFLHPPIRILLESIARLHKPNRCRHDEFAPARLLITC